MIIFGKGQNMIYFDNAATTAPIEQVKKVVAEAMEDFGNPSSLHGLGLTAQQKVSYARKIISGALGVTDQELFFTSGATESNNTAIFGAANSLGKRKPKIVVSSVEHPSVAEPCSVLEERGFEVVRVHPRENEHGERVFFAEDFVREVDDRTCLVTMMLCNNETGAVLPVAEVFRRVKKLHPDTLTHCDAVQAFMKLPVKAKKLNADMISVSGHKVHALKGIGGLYVRKGVHLPSLVFGGGQERGFRSGTESVPLIAAFGAAVEILSTNLDERYKHVSELSSYLRSQIAEAHPNILFNSPDGASPYVNSIAVKGLRSEVLLHYLEKREIYVSSGSACSKGKKSSVLGEFGVPDELADSTLRISFSYMNQVNEVDTLLAALDDAGRELVSK